jgi:hypothetical protein
MTDPEKPDAPDDGAKPADASPTDELKAAFGHLKSAADLFLHRIRDDEGLKKAVTDAETAAERAASQVERAASTAAVEAEKAVRTLGEKAQPIAKDIGAELGRLAKSMRAVLEPEPIPAEGDGKTQAATSEEAPPGPTATHDRREEDEADEEAKKKSD